MAKIPAYITIAFDLAGAVSIQQIQRREVLDIDGQLTEVKQYPPVLIKAPQDNDVIGALLTEALDAVAAGSLLAVASAEAERDAAVARFDSVNGANIETLQADNAAKDANIQALLAKVADLEAAASA